MGNEQRVIRKSQAHVKRKAPFNKSALANGLQIEFLVLPSARLRLYVSALFWASNACLSHFIKARAIWRQLVVRATTIVQYARVC